MRLTSQFPLTPNFQSDTGDFGRQRSQSDHHPIDRIFEIQDFTTRIDLDLFAEIAECDCFGDFGDGSDLGCEIGC
jgi:hypothetical protein